MSASKLGKMSPRLGMLVLFAGLFLNIQVSRNVLYTYTYVHYILQEKGDRVRARRPPAKRMWRKGTWPFQTSPAPFLSREILTFSLLSLALAVVLLGFVHINLGLHSQLVTVFKGFSDCLHTKLQKRVKELYIRESPNDLNVFSTGQWWWSVHALLWVSFLEVLSLTWWPIICLCNFLLHCMLYEA